MKTERTPHACVFGLGWGDEGKGKIVDLLCPAFGTVVRFNGGANAGHTVCIDGEKFALHLLPTGVLHDHATSIIGPGVVVDPIALLEEIDALAARGIDLASRLRISERAHLVLSYHKIEDRLSEHGAGEGARLGTTVRGIGPCYADKMRRTTAVRFSDLLSEDDLTGRIASLVTARKVYLSALFGEDGDLTVEGILADLETARTRLGPFVTDTTQLLRDTMDAGRPVLFEGANGVLLDVDHGTYPFVTSSSTGPHGIGCGAGVDPALVACRIGVAKAYATRVGSGPFMTELDNAVGDRIRQQGQEFGTTTGRPRRCGWFDAVACRYSARLCGTTDLALLHLDTLSGLDQIGVCTAYRCEGQVLTTLPADAGRLERTEPVFEYFPGWKENLRGCRTFDQLPQTARAYVEKIELLVGVRASILGVGPDRAQTILREGMDFLDSAKSAACTQAT